MIENDACSPTNPVRNQRLMSFYYVYVLYSLKDHNWYTGYTSDLRPRLQEHISGQSKSTRHRRPLKLIYFEGCLHKAALARERSLKSGMDQFLCNYFSTAKQVFLCLVDKGITQNL
jgi:putative endonuclease